jgi:hypothetical protein
MAVESSKETPKAQLESLIDDLIHDIFNESGGSPESPMRGMATTTSLFENVLGSARGGPRTSMVERMLLAEAFAAELADALAPALAEQLAPRLMKAMDKLAASQAPGEKPASSGRPGSARPGSARSSSRDRKPEAR